MDVQEHLPPPPPPLHRPQDNPHLVHYAQPHLVQEQSKTPSLPPLASLPHPTPLAPKSSGSSQEATTTGNSSMISSTKNKIPACVFEKRKSSPAILGVPLGLDDEAQAKLSLHLSRHRNSIEAAMLLANLNRQPATPASEEVVVSKQMADDDHDRMSIDSDNASTQQHQKRRRHSYYAGMSWSKMPESFLERYQDASTTTSSLSSASSSSASSLVAGRSMWMPATALYKMAGDHPFQHHHSPYVVVHGEYPIPPPASDASLNGIHPLARTTTPTSSSSSAADDNPTSGQKRDMSHMEAAAHHPPPPPPYFSYHPYPHMPPSSSSSSSSPSPSPSHHQALPPLPPPPPHHYYYQHHPYAGKLPLPMPMDGVMPAHHPHHPPYSVGSGSTVAAPPRAPTKRKKARTELDEDDMANAVEPGDPDFPDMSLKDIEAARIDIEARPRRQKLRYPEDKYTPKWVRYNGQAKEGLCDTCQPGKWLQLKNSAFWYHKQFFHGISSVSGQEFMQPLETRWVDQDLVEGLCHQCYQWVSVSNVKRKNSVLWYRHAHKCHVYHKPKATAPKRR
ncbi:hypothetical protein K492DRAFT_234411 [Lichtheimia hyalospora FSU 10163]|nr:hypothetical protein K492DRAFT_234411 [Lichtheimia hyalospora FSU 10163]